MLRRILWLAVVLLVLLPTALLFAQVYQKTRTTYVDVQAWDRYEFGRIYAKNTRDLITKRYDFLRGAGPSEECLKMLLKSQGLVVRSMPKEYDEINGIGETVGIKADRVLFLGLFIPLWDLAQFPGSTVALGPKRTADGKVWLALNVDHELEQAPFGTVIRRRWEEHPTTLMWTLAGGVGFAGVNSSGLAITATWLKIDGEDVVPGTPGELLIREALLKNTIEEARAVFADPEAAPQVMSSFAVILADSKGKMVLIERTPQAFSGVPSTDILIHTNHFLDTGFARADLGKTVFPDTIARYKTLKDAVAAKDKFSVDDLKALMSNHDGKPNSICRHGVQKTIASILLCPNDGVLMVTQGPPCTAKWETFKIDDPVRKAED